ncbi:MAG: hypothetical protein PHU85_13450 [Phycisphaerae bacterium]|nr:hypothetical protein [Phycisphaerae bacterium]
MGKEAMNESQSIHRNTTVPAACRNAYDKAMTGRKPLAAIRAKCHDCQNWQLAEIRGCAIDTCPLWPYRMGRKTPSASPQNGKEGRKTPNHRGFGKEKGLFVSNQPQEATK